MNGGWIDYFRGEKRKRKMEESGGRVERRV